MDLFQKRSEITNHLSVNDLKASEEYLRNFFSGELEYCSLFILPVNRSDPDALSFFEYFMSQLSSSFRFRTEAMDFPQAMRTFDDSNIQLYYLAFENVDPSYLKQELLNKICQISGRNHRSIRYNKYGLFIPRTGRIICFSFAHSGSMYYRYRVAEFKLKYISTGLSEYLLSLLHYCPNEYFFNGSRASGFTINIYPETIHSRSHEMCSLTEKALETGKFKSGHENVEKYFLESDPRTIACEVPVWYEQITKSKLKIDGVLTGHIDILRYEEDGRIGIWDYKPRAKYEKKAHMQVYLYALMLSQRTGIPLNNFLCGYFDLSDAYFFYPDDRLRI